jgi:pyridoxal biosynthesis lyase PdxS
VALLRPEIGTADCRRAGAISQASEPEEILEEVPVRADAEVPLAHRFEHGHLLDAIQVEVL